MHHQTNTSIYLLATLSASVILPSIWKEVVASSKLASGIRKKSNCNLKTLAKLW